MTLKQLSERFNIPLDYLKRLEILDGVVDDWELNNVQFTVKDLVETFVRQIDVIFLELQDGFDGAASALYSLEYLINGNSGKKK